ncbi:MAG: hypothetical protein N3I86_15640, partial [Verrucomicrobiae bacterium]|nr:hypothetical protein [Verrucomicrobiae bacterium]
FQIIVVPPPRFVSVLPAGNDLVLSWQTFPGKTYRVQFKNDLNEPQWTTLGDWPASGWTLAITNALDASPQRFFRLVQVN